MSEPIHIISLGAGVQSSTMALMAAHGEITPMPKCAIFADTQDEPKSVYVWLDWLEKQLPFPVHRVTAGKLSESATNLRWSRDSGNSYIKTPVPVFYKGAGMGRRQCTADFKIEPIRKFLRAMNSPIITWIGISLDEAHRMKPSRDAWNTHIWPLVERRMSRWGCIEWIKKNKYPTPPRSACVYCPYHSDSEWRRLKTEQPLDFENAVKFEHSLQFVTSESTAIKGVPYLHRSCVPLREVDFSTDEDHGQQVMFGNECEGMCGV